MNKLLLLSGLAAGLVLSSAAQAQSYNPNYPSQVGASYYNSRRPAASSNGLKKFSIGMDYVIGSTSVADKNFIMKSPLTGGNDYTGSTEDFEDKIFRAMGTLKMARKLTSNEFYSLISLVRLGISMGSFDENYETVSKLLHEVGTATIMSASDEGLTVDDTDKIRAQYVRESLS